MNKEDQQWKKINEAIWLDGHFPKGHLVFNFCLNEKQRQFVNDYMEETYLQQK